MVKWDCGKNYYKVLGVSSKASIEEIRDKYKKLTRENHSNLNPKTSVNKISEIKEAYNILGDRVTRALYDRFCILDFDDDINDKVESKKNIFKKIKDEYKNRFLKKEESNLNISDISKDEYKNIINKVNTIYDQIDMEIHYIRGFDDEVKQKREEIINIYNYNILTERLSMPFYNRALNLLSEYNLDLRKDKKYNLLYEELISTLLKTLYRLSRILECNSYTILYDSSKSDYHDTYINKVNNLYVAIFELIGMDIDDAFFIESYLSLKKDLSKQDKKILNLKCEISRCFVSYNRLTDKIKNRNVKTIKKK